MTSSFTAEFAADVRRDLALDAEAAAVEVSVRRARLEPVRRDLPAALVSHHPRGEPAVEASRRRHRGGPGPADTSMIVELGCGSGEKLVMLAEALAGRGPLRARAPHRHFVAGARADRAAADPAPALLGRRPSIDVRSRAAPCRGGARRRRPDARAPPRLEHRQLRRAGRARLPPPHPAGARARRPAPARRGSRQAGAGAAARVRRSARRDRRLQQESPGPHQSRARRELRSRRLRSPRRLERRRSSGSRCTSSAGSRRRSPSRRPECP